MQIHGGASRLFSIYPSNPFTVANRIRFFNSWLRRIAPDTHQDQASGPVTACRPGSFAAPENVGAETCPIVHHRSVAAEISAPIPCWLTLGEIRNTANWCGRCIEPGQHIAYILGADAAGRRRSFKHQGLAQPQQWSRHVQKRRTVSQSIRLSLHQIDVVLPVVIGLTGTRHPGVTGHNGVVRRNRNTNGVQPGADHVSSPFARHRVTVTRHRHQTGAAHRTSQSAVCRPQSRCAGGWPARSSPQRLSPSRRRRCRSPDQTR